MNPQHIKQQILQELDSRIGRLDRHAQDEKPADNPYSELNHALSHAIGESLRGELSDVREFVEKL